MIIEKIRCALYSYFNANLKQQNKSTLLSSDIIHYHQAPLGEIGMDE